MGEKPCSNCENCGARHNWMLDGVYIVRCRANIRRLIVAVAVLLVLLIGSNVWWLSRDAARRDAPAPASSAACAAESGVSGCD